MFYRPIFVCLVGFFLVKLVEMDPSVITFNIQTEQEKGIPVLVCDHIIQKIADNLYTVYEEGNFTIVTKYKNAINHNMCYVHTDPHLAFHYTYTSSTNNVTTFTGARKMGTVWVCTILVHRDNGNIQPVRVYNNHTFSAAYCYMKIHVRQKEAPQTILVNNMKLPALRTDLSQKDVDFIAEYQYEDGDVVDVTCINERSDKIMLTMEYKMAGAMSNDSIMDELKSRKMIGFTTRLHSGHSNSYMICTHTEDDDYTKVMVRFVQRTNFNKIISITINGRVQSPHLDNALNNFYRIDYKYVVNKYMNVTCEVTRTDVKELLLFDEDFNGKIKDNMNITINGMVLPSNLFKPGNNHYRIDYSYVSNQTINVTCEVERTDVKLSVIDEVFTNKGSSSNKKVIPRKKFEMNNFYLTRADNNKKLECAIDYLNGTSAETVAIYFTEGGFPIEEYPLHMELPSSGRVMEVYNDYKLNVIFYEYKDEGETLQLKCGQLRLPKPPGPVLYLKLASEICEKDGQFVPKNWTVTRENENTPIECNLMEKRDPSDPSASDKPDIVLRTIRVIFRETVLTTTTTSSTTTTTTVTSITIPTAEQPAPGEISPTDIMIVEPRGTAEDAWLSKNMLTKILIIVCCVVCIIIICASIVIIKLRKRNNSQRGPHIRNYENLQEPSEGSIPAYPPQWENNYAVPVDRRTEDMTYSVPCPPDLYATPTPKSLRNKKQKPLDPTYAVLTVPKNRGQKNMFKETEDPNYSEVYANRPEACYAKVLPKSQRNNAEQDNPYSYVTNDRPCAFTADPEPMYCEPGKARDAEYANLNNSHYANSSPPEYVEPTYCEPQKRMK